MTIFDFKKNSPTHQDSFKVVLRQLNYEFDLYKIKSLTKKIKRKELNKRIWGIYDGQYLYINCFFISFKKSYSIAEEIGSSIYIKAPPIMSLATVRK